MTPPHPNGCDGEECVSSSDVSPRRDVSDCRGMVTRGQERWTIQQWITAFCVPNSLYTNSSAFPSLSYQTSPSLFAM